MVHDFKRFPELRNNQIDEFYFDSPHKQITESFDATVVKVTDGDTIRVKCNFRDFDFPIRFSNIDAPEKDTRAGVNSKRWLENKILNANVHVKIDPRKRVGKWGRLLAEIIHIGRNINELSLDELQSVPFGELPDGAIPDVSNWENEIK